MKTRWVWMLAALTLAMLVGYALAGLQPSDGDVCPHCKQSVVPEDRANIHSDCLDAHCQDLMDHAVYAYQHDESDPLRVDAVDPTR